MSLVYVVGLFSLSWLLYEATSQKKLMNENSITILRSSVLNRVLPEITFKLLFKNFLDRVGNIPFDNCKDSIFYHLWK